MRKREQNPRLLVAQGMVRAGPSEASLGFVLRTSPLSHPPNWALPPAPLAGEEAEGARAETRPRPRACWLLNPGQANSRPRTTIRTLSPPGEGAALREGEAVLPRVGLGPCLLFSRPQAKGGVWAVEKALD